MAFLLFTWLFLLALSFFLFVNQFSFNPETLALIAVKIPEGGESRLWRRAPTEELQRRAGSRLQKTIEKKTWETTPYQLKFTDIVSVIFVIVMN
ncbi:hypothetical protein HY04_02980 [Kaistella antarctica]|uniref:Uncharacterized protein n=1 Tax=Kaistella antarctica TaxID=266748 RepID=A0ABR4U1X9_9FLAO|nr:hypothetical protein HY04_02980 [Kaistella antarctica]